MCRRMASGSTASIGLFPPYLVNLGKLAIGHAADLLHRNGLVRDVEANDEAVCFLEAELQQCTHGRLDRVLQRDNTYAELRDIGANVERLHVVDDALVEMA